MTEIFESYLPLKYRFPFGILVFIFLAIADFRRAGWKSERLREYVFLLYCVFLAIVYAVINDLVTSEISLEYFTKGKGLPDGPEYKWNVIWLAIQGSYWVGLLSGVVLLVANNKFRDYPRLEIFGLWKYPLLPIPISILLSILLFNINRNYYSDPVPGINDSSLFYAVIGAHKGAYFGGAIGTFVSLILLLGKRGKLKRAKKLPTNF